MLRKILSTTALVAVVSAGAAFAQDTNTADPMKQPEASSGMETGAAPVFPDRQAAGDEAKSFYGATDQQVLASSLLGWPVYGMSAENQEREQVGDVADIVMNTDGSANAAVIGVGGFLGIGEKKVAISFDRLSWQPGDNGAWLSIDATREELESAPEFKSDDENLMKVGRAPAPEGTMADGATDLANTAGTALDQAGNATGDAMNDMAENVDNAGDAMQNDGMMATAENPMLEGMSEVDTASISYDELEGAPVLGADGDSVGEISDIIVYGDNNENVFVVDVGGFLGIGEKPVAISAETATVMSDGDSYVIQTRYDRATLENQPEYTEQSLNDNPDAVLLN
ncbi:PRC-barrel domain-containing protein [Martelella soudanensis]|uniref:PRC-barrel domain-containing protein n=1 Tax=unclassified Martelella TaxID=2629616 RepID=UPI0015DE8243|nr:MULTISPECIES: PRC-barrel domain-containing protein [unclassified Martelella]